MATLQDSTPELPNTDPTAAVLTGGGRAGKQWLRSFEEDTDTETVYRPIDWNFPPARRGRTGFTFLPDGTIVERSVGPADQGVASPTGTWSLHGAASESADTSHSLRIRPAGEPERILDIVAITPDRMVVRKGGTSALRD